jgi:hypothetical protein
MREGRSRRQTPLNSGNVRADDSGDASARLADPGGAMNLDSTPPFPPRARARHALAVLVLLALGILLVAGCSGQGASSRRELTQRQRDSVLGASAIPGAFTVKRALSESDRATRQAASFDAQVDSLAH